MNKIYDSDPYLAPYRGAIDERHGRILSGMRSIAGEGRLSDAVKMTVRTRTCHGIAVRRVKYAQLLLGRERHGK